MKERGQNNRMGRTRDFFKKIRISREHFMQRWAQKGQKLYGPNKAEDIKKRWQECTEELYK